MNALRNVGWPQTALLLSLGIGLGCGSNAPADDVVPHASEHRAADPAAQRVRIAAVHRASVGGFSGVTGITSAFRTTTVAAEVSARVVERHVEPGRPVDAGDPLVSLDDTHLAIAVDEARATLAARKVDLAEAHRELARGDELARQGVISEGRHDDLRFATQRATSARDLADAALRRAQRMQADAVVRAPFAGTVELVYVQVGDYLSAGTPVAVIADFERVRFRAGLTAGEVIDLSPGAMVAVSIPALGDYESQAAIHSVGLIADATTGTYPVELWLDNPNRRIRGGMVGQLRMPAPEDTTGAIAPRAAILRRDGQLSVYVVEERDGETVAVARRVQVGRQQGDFVELLGGVEAGERVVVDGLFALTDGAAVFIDEPSTPAARSSPPWSD